MVDLVKITQNAVTGIQTVDARELHEFLGVKTRFNDWIVYRIRDYGFLENQDFTTFTEISVKGKSTNYTLTLDCAKELAMVERNEKGRQVRQYFIEAEKRYREIHQQGSVYTAQILKEVLDKVLDLGDRLLQLEASKASKRIYAKRPIISDYSWKNDLDAMLSEVYEVTGTPCLLTTMKWIIDRVPQVRTYGHRRELTEYLREKYSANLDKYNRTVRFKQYMGFVNDGGVKKPIYADHQGRAVTIWISAKESES